MSLLDKNITKKSSHTAEEVSEIDIAKDQLGRFEKSYKWRTPNWDLNKITPEILDPIIDNILSYIFYYVKIGLNNQNYSYNSHEIKINTCVFGVTRENNFTDEADKILEYVFREFDIRGFETTYLFNDMMIIISWDKTYEEMIEIMA